MIVRSRLVVTMDGPPIEDGAVAISPENGQILAAGPFAAIRRDFPGETLDLGEQALLPGLINAHCHLDYTGLRHAIPPQASFTGWISQINALKRQLTEADYLRAIADGFAELKHWGTTTVCNLEAFPELIAKLPPPPIRTWWFLELIDIRSPVDAGELLARALRGFQQSRPGPLSLPGLNPHAPYTASPELYRLCATAAARCGAPLSTHLAESADEEAMFRHARGELYGLLKKIGRPMDDCGSDSAFSGAVRRGLVAPGWIVAHANELGEADLALIAGNRGNPVSWQFVHCPRSHAYFSHRPFPWRELRAAGAGVSLGTDSLASNDALNLFAELRAAQKAAPWLTSEQLMETVTTQPARALGKSGKLGAVVPGAHADLIALPFAGKPNEIYDALVANLCPIRWMMLDGKLV